MGVAAQATPSAGLVSEVLFDNSRIVVGRRGHPLSGARSLRELATADWATPSLDLNAAVDLNHLFAQFDLPPPNIRLQAHSAMTVLAALSSSDLLAMLPRQWMDWSITQTALQPIPVQEHLPAPDILFVRRADLPLTPAAEHFSDLLRRHAK
jgi:DNA-binding transcriptional LysR family regulator